MKRVIHNEGICSDVGEATINRVFEKLRVEGKIEVVYKVINSK